MIPDEIAEALTFARKTLKRCRPECRDGVQRWIDQLLDMVNRR